MRATIDDQHHLGVSIETRDNGHAGEDGFMYLDDPHHRLEGVELESQHETRIDDHWVRWSYDID